MSESTPQPRKLRTITNPRGLILFVAIVLAVGVIAFLAGRSIKSSDAIALDTASQTQIDVFAHIEERAVATTVVLQGIVQAPMEQVVAPSAPLGADAAVITVAAPDAGTLIGSGGHLGDISGRPIFALTLPIATYRDLHISDRGPDVGALQTALLAAGFKNVSVTSVMDRNTVRALSEMYKRVGALAPGAPDDTYMRQSEIVRIPLIGVVAASVGTLGSEISETSPLVVLESGQRVVKVRASLLDAEMFEPGGIVTVDGPGAQLEGSVLEVSAFSEADPDAGRAFAGVDLTIALPTGSDVEAQTPVTVSSVGSDQTSSLAIPLIGIRQDGSSTYVLKKIEGKDSPVRVDVDVLRQASGWAAIAKSSELEKGDELLIS
jgi:peptidoglycan hydrolase-like protein with peptidoglycan-binding domain